MQAMHPVAAAGMCMCILAGLQQRRIALDHGRRQAQECPTGCLTKEFAANVGALVKQLILGVRIQIANSVLPFAPPVLLESSEISSPSPLLVPMDIVMGIYVYP